MNKTRYSATEFGRNKPMNFRPSGTLRLTRKAVIVCNSVNVMVSWLNIRTKCYKACGTGTQERYCLI